MVRISGGRSQGVSVNRARPLFALSTNRVAPLDALGLGGGVSLDDPLGSIRGIAGCVRGELEGVESAGDVGLFQGLDLLLGIQEARQEDVDVGVLLDVVRLIDAGAEEGEAKEDLMMLAVSLDREGGESADQDWVEIQDGVAKAGEFLHLFVDLSLDYPPCHTAGQWLGGA